MGIQFDGLVFIIPCTLNLGIANLVSINPKPVNPKVGQNHWIGFQTTDQRFAGNEAIEIEVPTFGKDIEIGNVELVQLQRDGVAFIQRHIAIQTQRLLVMAEHQVGDVDTPLRDINEIVGRHVPQRVVDGDVGITNVDDAAFPVGMERRLDQSLVVVVFVDVIPFDACGDGVVAHLGKERKVVEAYRQRVGGGNVGPTNAAYRKRTV